MRKIKNNELLRVNLGITQEEFADYLGVTRTLLSMNEKGFRSLPTPALLKMANLEIIYHNFLKVVKSKKTSATARHPQLQKHHEKLKKSMRDHAAFCHDKKNVLQYKLEKMQKEHAYAETWSLLLDDLLAKHQKEKSIDFDPQWLEAQKKSTLKKMMRCGTASQAKLQATIQILGVEAQLYNKLHEEF
jgi:transcriptional regulator with XRE-family HTH domain